MLNSSMMKKLQEVFGLGAIVQDALNLIISIPSRNPNRDEAISKLQYVLTTFESLGEDIAALHKSRGDKISATKQLQRDNMFLIFKTRHGDEWKVTGWENICRESGLSEKYIRQALTPSSKRPPSYIDADGDLITISRPKQN